MSVYVDTMRASFGRMTMCHMVADTTEELLAMAAAIGVDRKWIQKQDTYREHFDICLTKRAKAVELGAIEITQRETLVVMAAKRVSCPHDTDGDGNCHLCTRPGATYGQCINTSTHSK